MSLFQLCLSSLKASRVPVESLQSTLLVRLAEEIEDFRLRFHRRHKGSFINTHPFYNEFLHVLKKMIQNRGDELLDEQVAEIKLRDESDPLRQEVAYLMDNRYEMLYHEFRRMLKDIVGFNDQELTFTQEVTNIYCDDHGLVYHWDLDEDYKLIRSKFTRSSKLDMDDDWYDPWGTTPMTRTTRLLFNSFLVEIEYVDYADAFMHGDDLSVKILFEPPRSLDALLLEPISKRPSKKWLMAKSDSRDL